MSETIEIRRKRLIHRSHYTGMKETDLLLGNFARKYVPSMTEEQLDRYELLLSEPDPTIYGWITGHLPIPPEHDHDVMALLKAFKLVP